MNDSPSSTPEGLSQDLGELFRQEAEGITDRLDLLLGSGTEEAVAEALRLAHTLKGLAVSTESLSMRDLARSIEAALAGYSADDLSRRGQLLSAIDAARGLVSGSPDAPAAARLAAAALQGRTRALEPRTVPVARRALLRRLLGHAAPILAGVEDRLAGLQRGEDDWRLRTELARRLEVWAAAAGLLGASTLASLGLELAAFLFERTPSAAALEAARRSLDLVRSELANDVVDRPLPALALAGVEALRASTGHRLDEERLPIPVELPWPDVDQPVALLRAVARLCADQAVLDARSARSSCRFLRGTIGLAPLRRSRRVEEGFVRVPRRRLDRLLRRAEELVAAKSRARSLARSARKLAESAPPGARLGLHRLAREAVEHDRELDHLARATQEAVLRARLVTVRALFALARMTVAEHLSRHPGKEVQIDASGAGTEIDKGTLDGLVEPLLNLIKNALEHGVEPREVRIARGKVPAATIRLAARAGSAGVTVEVEDDGPGLNVELLGAERDLVLLEEERQAGAGGSAFAAGVSTAPRVTDDAGRGVGLSSVLERVRSLRGRLVFRSKPGVGTLARLIVPPAAATARVLLVRVGQEHYALPLATVRGVARAGARGGIPRVRLEDLVGRPTGPDRRRAQGNAGRERRMQARFEILLASLVSRGEGDEEELLALVVDDVLRRDLVVVRSIGRRFAHPGVDGAALFGDGRLVLVLDVWRLHATRAARAGLERRADPADDGAP